jgi:hypothetical protein
MHQPAPNPPPWRCWTSITAEKQELPHHRAHTSVRWPQPAKPRPATAGHDPQPQHEAKQPPAPDTCTGHGRRRCLASSRPTHIMHLSSHGHRIQPGEHRIWWPYPRPPPARRRRRGGIREDQAAAPAPIHRRREGRPRRRRCPASSRPTHLSSHGHRIQPGEHRIWWPYPRPPPARYRR